MGSFGGFGPIQGDVATSLYQGDNVIGGVAGCVLYLDSSGLLKSEAAFAYNETTNTLSVDILALGGGTALLVNDGTAIAALKNGATAQTFHNYRTSSGADTARLELGWSGNSAMITTRRGGSAALAPLIISANAAVHLTLASPSGDVTFTPTASTSGAPTHWTHTGPADTGMTASTEVPGINFNLSATRQWATGALTLQREFLVQAPTYGFVGASTLSDAVTFAVSGPPIAGSNATLTRAWIATFGTLEATARTPVAAVGIFNAGATELIVRNTTSNVEGFFASDGGSSISIGTATNSDVNFFTNNTSRFTLSGSGFRAAANYDIACANGANATTGTVGFLFMNSCAGDPTGVPATIPTGQKAYIYNSTAKTLWLYDGGWLKARVAGVDVIFS